eukprot:UN24343
MNEWENVKDHSIHRSLTNNMTTFLKIEQKGEHLKFKRDDIVVKQGDPADKIYLVTNGTLLSRDKKIIVAPGTFLVYYAMTNFIYEKEFYVATKECQVTRIELSKIYQPTKSSRHILLADKTGHTKDDFLTDTEECLWRLAGSELLRSLIGHVKGLGMDIAKLIEIGK